ncbi:MULTISPECIES: cell division protein FtsZ [Mannheimia]|uniref:Cell division protein FtsZ n=1 Tax=Mannheimia pernigra TaxID=111844 RepID=A0ABD7A7N0_9PAST|nr:MULTISPECIES: cell division protein FtsZ [Mannheimia]QLB42115.1 cell division protein FtsZ [Mannheimia pernigra]QTM00646.1 cell division protein FtsZ [Mannheimia sp. ZY171111]
MFEPIYEQPQQIVNIKVVGVGGGGGNAVNSMCRSAEGINGVEFYDINTDAQVLRTRTVSQTIQIGGNLTGGRGAGGRPEIGQKSALEDKDAIANALSGAHMVFIAAGMGGGTGTGAAPIVAQIAKEQGALTVGVVTKPFRFEQGKRMRNAEEGIRQLSQYVDSLIVIPNDKLRTLGKGISMVEAFAAADDVLSNCVLGISNMITSSGGSTGIDINVDFADVENVMSDKGIAMIGTGFAEGAVGEGRAEAAMEAAISSPLLENVDITGATGMLINISAGTDFALDEVYAMMDLIEGRASEDADVIFGCNYYPEMDGKVSVTLVATGIGQLEEPLNLAHKERQKHSPFVQQTHPDFTKPLGYNQSNQFEQPQVQKPVAPKPQSVDSAQIFNPSSMPGFMRK